MLGGKPGARAGGLGGRSDLRGVAWRRVFLRGASVEGSPLPGDFDQRSPDAKLSLMRSEKFFVALSDRGSRIYSNRFSQPQRVRPSECANDA